MNKKPKNVKKCAVEWRETRADFGESLVSVYRAISNFIVTFDGGEGKQKRCWYGGPDIVLNDWQTGQPTGPWEGKTHAPPTTGVNVLGTHTHTLQARATGTRHQYSLSHTHTHTHTHKAHLSLSILYSPPQPVASQLVQPRSSSAGV